MKKFNQTSILPVFVLLTAFSCAPKQVETEEEVEAINLSYMDTSTRAQDDFFQYVNGSWLAEAEIPADQGRWGSFLELRDQSIAGVKQVMESAKENISEFPKGTDQYKAVTFYTIGMDSLLAEKEDIRYYSPGLKRSNRLKHGRPSGFHRQNSPRRSKCFFQYLCKFRCQGLRSKRLVPKSRRSRFA